jgi:hypothetical protein
MLGLAWFYSSESRLFNELRQREIRKSLSPGSSRPGVSQDAGSICPDGKRIALILIFAKKLHSGYSRPVSKRFRPDVSCSRGALAGAFAPTGLRAKDFHRGRSAGARAVSAVRRHFLQLRNWRAPYVGRKGVQIPRKENPNPRKENPSPGEREPKHGEGKTKLFPSPFCAFSRRLWRPRAKI